MRIFLFLLLILPVMPLAAQQSPSFDLEEAVLNSGGSPTDGTAPTSASFSVSLGALGNRASLGLSGASFTLEGGFVAAYPPPQEVMDLRFIDSDTLSWDAEYAAGHYSLYRGLIQDLSAGYGSCFVDDIASPSIDLPTLPPAGFSFFYLVTSNNRLHEEGSAGNDSVGAERVSPIPCP